jgi:RNA polymerase sigma-70 factor, ECF subfamily
VTDTDVHNPADLALAQRILSGDEAAFRDLVNLHHASMVRLAQMYCGTPPVANEVAQEAWLAVLKGLPKFEGRSALKTWIFRILVNRAKTRGQREGRQIPFSALGSEDDGPSVDPSRFSGKGKWAEAPQTWEATTPEDMLQRKEAMEALKQALTELPDRQRMVVQLRDLDGWESEDVCNVLEISETNQRVLLHRGRTKLRSILEGHLSGR